MQGDEETADRYRRRAVEVREIAQKMTDYAGRKILETVAEDYERMARQMDDSAQVDRNIQAAHGPPDSN